MNERQPTPETMSLEEKFMNEPEKFFAFMEAMAQSSDWSEHAERLTNEVLVSKVEELVLNHIPSLEEGYAMLDEALHRLVPTRRNSAFPPGS